SSAGNVFKLTGVDMVEGTGESPVQIRTLGEEYRRCYRQLQVWDNSLGSTKMVAGNGAGTGANLVQVMTVKCSTTMRAAPSLTTAGVTTLGVSEGGADNNFSNLPIQGQASVNEWTGAMSVNGATTLGRIEQFHISAGGMLIMKAEL